MVTMMVRRAFRMAAAGAILSQGAVAEEGLDDGYELVSARLGDRDVLVFVDRNGVAVGLEVAEAGSTVVTGLAAGVLLSDVEAVRDGNEFAFRLDRTSPLAAATLIDGMAGLTEAKRAELKAALAI